MKLAIKISSLLVLGLLVVLAIDADLTVRHETAFFRTDMEHDAKLLGHAMMTLVADAWNTNGEQRALELIAEANRKEKAMEIRWVWLDGTDGDRFRPQIDGVDRDKVAAGEELSVQKSGRDGMDRLVTYVPVRIDDHRLGALELTESTAPLKTFQHRIIARSLGVMAALLAVSTVTITILGTLIIGRPLGLLVERVRQIGMGDLQTQVHLKKRDELGELAGALNRMCRDLAVARETVIAESEAHMAAVEQLRHADRLATVGRLASGIAHEVGTPLNVIGARAKQIENADTSDPETKNHAGIIARQSERIAAIIRQLLAFARPGRGAREAIDLADLANRTMLLLEPLASKSQVSLHCKIDNARPTVLVNPTQIEHVLANLIDNAIQAMPDGGEIHVRAGTCRARCPWDGKAVEDDYACVSIEDQGTGIDRENLKKIFDPFFTTKEIGEGTGLGLSLAYGIVREHKGWIDVTSTPSKGSCFSVFLPIYAGGTRGDRERREAGGRMGDDSPESQFTSLEFHFLKGP